MAKTPTGWNGGRPFNVIGLSRDNAPSRPVDAGTIARVGGGMRSWLGLASSTPNSRELPFFPPGQSLPPIAQGAIGRRFDYPTNYNATIRARSYEAIDFDTLRALAEPAVGGWDLIRLAVETRKDQMAKLTYSILPRKPANATLRPKSDDRCQQLEQFLRRPDGEHSWADWVRMLLEEHLVIDAATIYKRPALDGTVAKLEIIDGATIKPQLDYSGRRPTTGPAYIQNIKGLPAVAYTADELIYAPRNPRVNRVYGYSPVEQVIITVNIALRRQASQLGFYCYSDDTEVLTKRGWLRFVDTRDDDWFATRQIGTGVFEWQQPYDRFYKRYTGKMIWFTNRSLDLLVTPNHRMLVNSLPVKFGRAERGSHGEYVVPAEDLAATMTNNTSIPVTSVWVGEELGAMTFHDTDPRSKVVTISGDDYCAFMGAYLAEGNTHNWSVVLSQPKDDDRGAHDVFRALLEKVFPTGVGYSGHQLEVGCKALVLHLRQFGLAGDKFIPESILSATPRQLAIFWAYYCLGDGNARGVREDTDGGFHVPSQMVFTVSRRLAAHLTEVVQKLGMASTTWIRKAGSAMYSNAATGETRQINQREGYVITARTAKSTKFLKAETIDYDAPVACVSVPNKFLYVRRNGKASWSGNTEGNVPDAIAQVPPDWSTQRIAEWQDYWDTVVNDAVRRRKMKFIPGGVTFQQTRNDQALVDQFDEWLARVVNYCFSLPPTPLVRMMNRATAETSYESALDEGLQPLMMFIKNIMDDIITRWFELPDLEMVWDDVKKADPSEKEQRDTALMTEGVISRDDIRTDRGLEPLGIGPVVQGIGPLGFMSIEAMKKAIANGWDLTGMPQPGLGPDGMPVSGGEMMPGVDPAILGTGQDGDPLKDLPPELLEALGVGPAGFQANPSQPQAAQTEPGQQPSKLAGKPPGKVGARPGAPGASNVTPMHLHPAVQATLREGEAHAKRAAARLAPTK